MEMSTLNLFRDVIEEKDESVSLNRENRRKRPAPPIPVKKNGPTDQRTNRLDGKKTKIVFKSDAETQTWLVISEPVYQNVTL